MGTRVAQKEIDKPRRGVAKHDLERIREAKQDLQTALKFAELTGDKHLKTLTDSKIHAIRVICLTRDSDKETRDVKNY